MTVYQGQCLCGLVKYEVSRIEPKMGHCHCTMCRKFHGAAFATYGEAKRESFAWVTGEDQIKCFIADNGTIRKFCNNCGSSLVFQESKDAVDVVEFSLGTLDSDLDRKPDAHIFVSSKGSWSTISDNLPQFSGNRMSKQMNKQREIK